MSLLKTALLTAALFISAAVSASADSFPVRIEIDAAKTTGPVEPIWRFFGADEPNYATMKDGRSLLTSLGELSPGHVYFRAHNLLSTGDGTPAFKWGSTNAYTEDAQGNPVYNWTIIDHIFDTYLARGVKPYVEIGFMPEALSTNPEPYQHQWRPGLDYRDIKTGWAYPPRDYAKWQELVYQWVRHCVERYGHDEVASWYWETWNEANLDFYWGGTREEFFKLHEVSVKAVRRALPDARVGGPDMAGSDKTFLTGFMDHMEQTNTPTDFLSFHAKGGPEFIDGHVRMGIAQQLKGADNAFATIAARSAFRDKPIIIGEFDPEGCAACQGPANAYRNGTMYSSYTAASFPRVAELAQRRGVKLEGALSWAFEFEDQRYFAGFRQLASNGVDMPVLNVFRLFARMKGQHVAATSDHETPLDAVLSGGVRGDPDVGVTAARDGDTLSVLVWHYHDDDLAGPDAEVSLALDHLPAAFKKGAVMTRYRVDATHANSFAAWQAMGSPLAPDNAQYATLKAAAQLTPDAPVAVKANSLAFDLPRQGVTLLVITPAPK
ncbi:GH39 family glycosyl hydrolase [Asticcacaulis sp.]|uniref:GH39 family glycosyl hydrolase n=1 Tax=Asticcacaulis sp. TaxID=1872648 RepID=UPI002CB956D2|nr:beta-xylosidase [Asticcacaulis sp.]HTM81008.1 beta-xylosidase [Asticcacaulis sp.]